MKNWIQNRNFSKSTRKSAQKRRERRIHEKVRFGGKATVERMPRISTFGSR